MRTTTWIVTMAVAALLGGSAHAGSKHAEGKPGGDNAAKNPYRASVKARLLGTSMPKGVTPSTRGTWKIFAPGDGWADGWRPGAHLKTVEGSYGAAVEHAVDVPGFMGYGDGGHLERVTEKVKKLD